ncbi:iron-containing alcohol dehydrogenase [Peribacillus cavernae]|uniref:Iron-containing alcohol dehydrogenase n=1 Tax=Peribacillus cavernae TaxID=1674310 RepID=A0A433HWL3_9BACI|nr:iron-containing alcohol dehydrogenase [Peribacillus cavernae]MDQ0217922.1 alcohol dehydrogenase class IV [Peribacillus cavernae]RUQ32574.1 iron-containing alcohol dehydrogenase [Peribacillus cavernae]
MKEFSEFCMPKTVLYGQNSLTQLGEQVVSHGKKVFLISDRVMEKVGHVKICKQYFEKSNVRYSSYLDVNTEPTDLHIAEALKLCLNEQCDVIVAVGGGSCIDAAKAVAVLATNGGYIGDYVGGRTPIEKAPLPLIAIPTTAGTGSEVTNVTIITNTKEDIKMMIKHPSFLPCVAIVDSSLTISTPQHVTAATGIDALCHAIEAYLSRLSQPLTDTLALSAIEAITNHLRAVYENGEDLEARGEMAIAAMQAGLAFTNASVTLVHGMSRPIGALFHVPHGVSNAMLLPAVLEFTKEQALDSLAAIGRMISPNLKALTSEELADVTINEIKKLCLDLNIPNMKTWGVDEERFKQVVEKMATDALASGSPANNPRVPSFQEIVDLYHRCYNYDFTVSKSTIQS